MKLLLTIVLCFYSAQLIYSQEDDGVVSLALPVRNSLTFNQYVINPTFSFVRQQNKYISVSNKREWIQFDDAPQTYLFSYSGRFRENIGIGIGLFQQDYGVLTTFGGILNFAYNVTLTRESNLTFGLNLGFYKSGLNEGKVITNFPDPSLENIPSSSLLTINPGINYGTTFLDFGVSINNLVLYNINSSQLIEDNPEQSIQAHIMHTGYINSRGFFDDSKFSGLIRSEFRKDQTVISAIGMLTVPKGIWAQVGYNSLYGASGGLGINITNQISIEYNFEKALGDLTDFGPSHDITLAYKFKNNNRYNYSGDDEVSALITPKKKKRPVSKVSRADAEANRKLAIERKKAKAEATAQAALEAEKNAIAKAEEEAQAKLERELKAKEEADAQNKLQEENERLEIELKAKLVAEQLAKEKADALAKFKAEQRAKAKLDVERKTRDEEIAKVKDEAESKAKLEAEQNAKAEQERLLAEQKANEEVKRLAKLEEEQNAKVKDEAESKAKLEAEQNAKAEQERLLAEQKANEEVQRLAKLEEEQIAKAKAEAEIQAKIEAEKQAKIDAEQKAKAEEEAKQRLISNPTDEIGKSMNAIAKVTEDSKKAQDELLSKLSEVIANKDKDLKDLKEENDLSEKGIYKEPKPFKSVTAENNALESIKVDLDNIIKTRNEKIKELEDLYNKRRDEIGEIILDEVDLFYQKTIKRLQSEQIIAIKSKSDFEFRLDNIKTATEFERKRRIKRAAYDNEEDKYLKDRATLNQIKEYTPLSSTPLNEEDFDFGEEQSNIQIVKDVKNEESGYYLVIAVHSDVAKRDEFLTKAVAAGQTNINFFYNVNTSKYYIYYEKFDGIYQAMKVLKTKGSTPYNSKMSVVKIEN